LQIYELVSDFGSESSPNEWIRTALAQDEKFMALMEDIHNKKHHNFERGKSL
jgi:hypothetical protein